MKQVKVTDIKFKAVPEPINILGEEFDQKFLDIIKTISLSPESIKNQHDLKIVFTPLHGTTYKLVPASLRYWGFTNITTIPEQMITDGGFPTVESANPEEPKAGSIAGIRHRDVGRCCGEPQLTLVLRRGAADGFLGNVQSGQCDLGSLGIENFGVASVDYAQNSLYFTTARPVFRNLAAAGGAVSGNHAMQGVCPVSVTARFQAGSFNTYMPYLRADFRLTDRLSLSANAAGVFSKGNFPYGDGLVRANNDLQQVRAGLDLWGLFERGDFHVKAYYNDAKRGTPGAISWPSEDRQSDMNAFVQGTFRKSYSDLYTLRLSAKGQPLRSD